MTVDNPAQVLHGNCWFLVMDLFVLFQLMVFPDIILFLPGFVGEGSSPLRSRRLCIHP